MKEIGPAAAKVAPEQSQLGKIVWKKGILTFCRKFLLDLLFPIWINQTQCTLGLEYYDNNLINISNISSFVYWSHALTFRRTLILIFWFHVLFEGIFPFCLLLPETHSSLEVKENKKIKVRTSKTTGEILESFPQFSANLAFLFTLLPLACSRIFNIAYLLICQILIEHLLWD